GHVRQSFNQELQSYLPKGIEADHRPRVQTVAGKRKRSRRTGNARPHAVEPRQLRLRAGRLRARRRQFLGRQFLEQGSQYVIAVYPKARSKYVYRGKVWVDGTDFAVTRIDAEPAQNPSFWTKKNEVHHEYMKVQDFWFPRHNESISYIRLGGRATLTIDYDNYRVGPSRLSGNAAKPSSSDVGSR